MLMILDCLKLETLILLRSEADPKLILCLELAATLCVLDLLFNPSILSSDSPALVALDAPRLMDVRREEGEDVRDETLGVEA